MPVDRTPYAAEVIVENAVVSIADNIIILTQKHQLVIFLIP